MNTNIEKLMVKESFKIANEWASINIKSWHKNNKDLRDIYFFIVHGVEGETNSIRNTVRGGLRVELR